MKAKFFRDLESRFRELFRDKPEIGLSEIPARLTQKALYENWYDADEALENIAVHTTVGKLMCRLYKRHGSLDMQIETFEDSCLWAQALAVELFEIAVQTLYGDIPVSDNITYLEWLHLETIFDKASEEHSPFGSAYNRL